MTVGNFFCSRTSAIASASDCFTSAATCSKIVPRGRSGASIDAGFVAAEVFDAAAFALAVETVAAGLVDAGLTVGAGCTFAGAAAILSGVGFTGEFTADAGDDIDTF